MNLARRWLFGGMVGLSIAGCASVQTEPSPEARAALAPTGKLRVGVYLGNPLSVVRDPQTQELKGIGFELGWELARRMAVPFEPVIYPSVSALLDGAKSAQWDVTFMQISPARAKDYDFTAPLVEVELGYLVPKGSMIATSAEVDRPGTRIAIQERGQGDVILTQALKHASLVRVPGLAAGLERVQAGQAEALASIKPTLFAQSRNLEGWRVLDGRFAVEKIAMAVPKGRDPGMPYARRFIANADAKGLTKAAIERAGVRGAVVAPPQ